MELAEDAVQLHDVNVHWLELEMVGVEADMRKAKLMELVEDAVQLHDVNVHWLELEMVAEEPMRKATLEKLAKKVDADQLHDMKAKVLELATVSGPIMYIGMELLEDVAIKADRCTKNAALLLIEKFTSITLLA